jgi:hypothetical protein
MTFRRLQLSIVVMVFSVFFLSAGAVLPAGTNAAPGRGATVAAAAVKASPAPSAANWVFEGCWTQFAAGPCRDVFRDPQGSYWICRGCGTTGTPSTSKCSRISSQTLATGYWCS